uniref:Putative conserved secreted protein n=1 Tax=Ixodes ricinus TaxID=34613 RepID=V5GHA9_IXORI
MTHQRNYLAHQGKVVGIVFSLIAEWVLSVARDKYFQWHCSETGRRLGGFQCNAWCTALQFDAQSKSCIHVADYVWPHHHGEGGGNWLQASDHNVKGHSGSHSVPFLGCRAEACSFPAALTRPL